MFLRFSTILRFQSLNIKIVMENTYFLLNYFSDFLTSYRIREITIDRHMDDPGIIDYHYRAQLFASFDYTAYVTDLTSSVKPTRPIEFRDDFGFLFLVYMVPGEADETYHICGPYLYEACFDYTSEAELDLFMTDHQIPLMYRQQVKVFFERIPLVNDMLAWRQMLTKVFSRLYGVDTSILEVSGQYSELIDASAHSSFVNNSTLDYAVLEARYEAENRLLGAIKKGDTQKALYYHNQFMGFNLEERGDSPIASAKMYIIAANTLFRKAVEDAMVHPLYIDQLSGKITLEIESAKSLSKLNAINTTMIRRYCMLVQTFSREHYSPLIRDCMNHIDFHYREKLSLLFFSKKYSVSKNYLSTLFHNEVGMTLTNYINEARVRQAILLLNTTSMPIQFIAEQCGFADANYFTRTFKKLQGMSPLQYRQLLLKKS